jgi:NarL family two-component system response regulator LiaR
VNLLIIEENTAICRLIRSLVEGLPLSISECHDSSQALAVCAAVRPDWVLLDLNVAGTDALAATRQISSAYPEARVVVLTEDNDPRLREAAQQAGAWSYLLKENLVDVRGLLHR